MRTVPFFSALLLTACVTINIYFPAAAAEKVADESIKGIQSEKMLDSESQEVLEPQSHFYRFQIVSQLLDATVNYVIPAAHAENADLSVNTAEIRKLRAKMKNRFSALKPFYSRGVIGIKSGGFIENDKMPPGVLMDNIPSWEFGVLTHIRDFSLSMRDDLSRSQSQSSENKNLVKAQIRFNIDSEKWMLPRAEGEYNAGRKKVDAYVKELTEGKASFYARADNLRSLLNKMQKRLGSVAQNLSASVGQVRVNTDLAGDSGATGGSVATEHHVKTSWFEIDNVFYEARGQTWAILHILKAVEVDFAGVLKQKNALASVQQIIRELEATQQSIWSPVILNGRGFGFVTNHSLVMASYVSRANAALIDLKNLLENG